MLTLLKNSKSSNIISFVKNANKVGSESGSSSSLGSNSAKTSSYLPQARTIINNSGYLNYNSVIFNARLNFIR